ncbi:MAG: hypothetical protein Q8Q08_07125 [Candidatus Omnitrophota bacterium]|nr:hypothetical protein [Candidatus Omnitrophota bacterium]MDZ4241925.1 hypothetical protein [Candidatus Omnitrophota bacterium]
MSKMSFSIWGAAAGFLFLGLVPGAGAVSPGGGSMTSDDMLHYTLQDVQARLQEFAEENAKMSARNSSLRKRIMTVGQQIRDLENRNLGILEEKGGLKDSLDLGAQEDNVAVKTVRNLEEKIRFLENEGSELAARIAKSEALTQKLGRAIEEYRESIDQLAAEREGMVSASRDRLKEERYKLVQLLKDRRQRQALSEKNRLGVARQVEPSQKTKEDLLSQRNTLKRQANQLVRDVKALKQENERLAAEGAQMTREQKQSIAIQKAAIEQLRADRDDLSGAIQDALVARRAIVSQFGPQEQEARKMLLAGGQQGKALSEQERILSETLKTLEGLRQSSSVRDDADEKVRSLQEKIAALQEEHEQLRTKTSEGLAGHGKSDAQERALKAEIEQLRSQAKARQSKAVAGQQARLQAEKTGVFQSIRDYQARLRTLGGQRVSVQSELALAQKKSGEMGQQMDGLKFSLAAGEEDLAALTAAREQMARESEDIAGKSPAEQDRVRDELDTLKLRQAVLESSVSAIKTKFQEDEKMTQEFLGQDKQEMEEYLSVLQFENKDLQARFLKLQKSYDALRATKTPASSAPPRSPRP